MNWYYLEGSNRIGPVDESQLDRLIALGSVRPETLVWNETFKEWTALRDARPSAAATAPDSPPAAALAEASSSSPLAACSQCGNVFSSDQLMPFEGKMVCVNCKPLFLARLREGVAPVGHLEYGGFWIRFGAKVVDGLILGAVYLVLVFLVFPSMMLRSATRPGPPNAGMMAGSCLIQLVFYALGAFYYGWFVGRYGATPGKMALKLKIVKADGTRVSYGLAVGRFFAEILSAIILYIGYIMAAFDEEKRALHDRICNTRVVRIG